VWAGDQRQKLFRNLEVLPRDILLSAVTAPGAGSLPWDERVCAGLGEHEHSGKLGCRVKERRLLVGTVRLRVGGEGFIGGRIRTQ